MAKTRLLGDGDYNHLLDEWADMRAKLDMVEERIEEQARLRDEKVHRYGLALVEVREGRMSYDYEAIAQELKVPLKILKAHTKVPDPKTNWREACLEVGIPDPVLQKFGKQGEGSVSITLMQEATGRPKP